MPVTGRVHGRHGRLYLGATDSGEATPVAATKSWAIDAQTDYVDATAQGDTSKVSVAGLPGGSGSFEAFYETGSYSGNVFTAARDGLARKMYAYPDASDSSKYWFTTAFISGNISSPVDGITSVSGTFAAATDLIPVGIA